MAAIPFFEEASWSATGPMVAGLAGLKSVDPFAPIRVPSQGIHGAARKLSVYPGSAVFQLLPELEHLSYRAAEPNVFFNPRFLAPAIPRLEEKDIHLAVMRDEKGEQSRLRLVMPYAIERPAMGVGPSIMRCWGNVFGPNGTPLLDHDDPVGISSEFLEILGRPHLGLPQVLVFPMVAQDGATVRALKTAALGRDYPVYSTRPVSRVVLDSELDGDTYLENVFSGHHRRGFRRQLRRLQQLGDVQFSVARDPDSVFMRMEEFLLLENRGWKGRNRSAMASDRMQIAFAREAVNGLAERDIVRILTLDLNGKAVASLILLIEAGVAYTWKTTFDEDYAAMSPGMLLMMEATRFALDDPNVLWADSCASPDHPMMDRIWAERRNVETLVIGLGPQTDRAARQVAGQVYVYDRTRVVARSLRDRFRRLLRR